MFKSRKELEDAAVKVYVALMQRTADRYYNNTQYVISDVVGYSCTRIEELFRPLWGIAPLIGDERMKIKVGGRDVTIADFITDVILEGINENSEHCFDRGRSPECDFDYANQTVTEIAAYLVAVRLAPQILWERLTDAQRDLIALWISKWSVAALLHSWPNNHYWYPVYCIEILKQLGYALPDIDGELQKAYGFLDALYIGNGWYSDGVGGRYDYYEAWAHHTYTLLWTQIADKNTPGYAKRCSEYKRRSTEYLKYFIHYFDSDGGMAAYGRSIGYRFAAITPFGLAALAGCDIDFGQAKRVILRNVGYFLDKSIPTDDGVLPCGYLYETPGFTESYSTDGAITCYTEGLLCLLAGDDHPLWQAKEKALPVEESNYLLRCTLAEQQTFISGDNAKYGVTLYNNSLHYSQAKFFSHRFNDMGGYYCKFAYNSRAGFGISTADMVSSDNMISLYSPDGLMASHRRRIDDNEILPDGVMVSTHTPFSNDPNTKIKTWLVPLEHGYHVRVHKITLSQPYCVAEGGFAVGLFDDDYKVNGSTITYREKISRILLISKCGFKYKKGTVHPGMHLLAPQAIYPMYMTDTLDAGEYVFITTVYFSADGEDEPNPEISVMGNCISIFQNDKRIIIEI